MSEGFQGTHVDALSPFNSKLTTLNPRGGLWTFSAILALCAPPPIRAHARLVSIIYLSYFFRQITEGKVPWTGILVLARFFVNKTWYTCSLIYSSNHGGKSSVRAVSRQNRPISENKSGHDSYVFWRDSSKSTLSLVMWICSPFGERPILLSLLLSLFSW